MMTTATTKRQINAHARAAARAREKADEAKRHAAVLVVAKRLQRKHSELGSDDAERAGLAIAIWRPRDALAGRSAPELYRGWRRDAPRRMAYLLGDVHGLPLAHEGGSPIRCADRLTATLAHARSLSAGFGLEFMVSRHGQARAVEILIGLWAEVLDLRDAAAKASVA